jgi:hypothetical protein
MSKLGILYKAFWQLEWQESWNYALYLLQLHSGWLRRVTPDDQRARETEAGLWGLKPLKFSVDLARLLSNEEKEDLISQSDAVVSGQVRLFGGDPVPLKLAPEPPLKHWTKHRASLLDGQDIKFTWEPARFGWATVLARAYHLSRDEKYSAAFGEYTEKFLTTNPVNRGPNWVSAQEVALRLISLVFCYSLFEKSIHTTPARRQRLAKALAEHANRIPPTLAYARAQGNNHLLSEAAGLYTAACVLPEHPQAQSWRKLGAKWFVRGIAEQVFEDGTYIQQSANYHRLMLQIALWFKYVVNAQGRSLPAETLKRLAAAARWLLALLDEGSGGAPNMGANDGATILPLCTSPFADFRPVAQAASLAFLGERPLPHGPWDEMSAWLVSHPADSALTYSRPDILRLDGEESWGTLRAAYFYSRPGHNDQLHFDLWWRGLNVARDAGTYLYNAPPPWDNSLMVVAVHNTVTIDGLEPMTRAGRFLWLDWNQAEVLQIADNRMSAQHRGFPDMLHRRTVLLTAGDRWLVKDELIPENGKKLLDCQVRLHWLLPDWPWELTGTCLRIRSPYGWVEVAVNADIPLQACLVRAGEKLAGSGGSLPTWGWYSPTYGVKEAALSFALYGRAISQVNLSTMWYFPDQSNRTAD